MRHGITSTIKSHKKPKITRSTINHLPKNPSQSKKIKKSNP